MRKVCSLLMVFCLFLFGSNVFAMTSTNFSIQWDDVNQGGLDVGTSTNYSVRDTIGGVSVGTSTSNGYQLFAGYRAPEASYLLSYIVRTGTVVSTAYSGFVDGVGGTVTVTSAAGFAVGDLIAVVENTGFSELAVVAKITDISGLTITVDRFEGDGGAMNPSPVGGNDFVYLLSANSFSFGTVTVGSENTAVVGTSVQTNIPTGYSIYIQASQDLQNGSAVIMNSVSDGTVTAGSEEYGAEVTGSTAVNPGTDLGVTTTQRVIQSSGTGTGAITDKVAMIYKLAISGTTGAGTYSQSVYYALTANY